MVLDTKQRDIVFKLAEKLTGVSQEEEFRRDVLVSNVIRRMSLLGFDNLMDYLQFVDSEEGELAFLISALTIHTTSWMREKPHFDGLQKRLSAFNPADLTNMKFRLISTACSTGEEVYSFALVLEDFRSRYRGFDYEIWGLDVDPISVHAAKRAVYTNESLKQIPEEYQRYLLYGEGKAAGFFTLTPEIKTRCHFRVHNLLMPPEEKDLGSFHMVVCRNVLIYFSPEKVEKIIRNILRYLKPEGVMVLGHSEAINARDFNIKAVGNSTYLLNERAQTKGHSRSKVLVVDDSATVRQMLSKLMEANGLDCYLCKGAMEATQFLEQNSVDLITLDLNMPDKDGKSWLLEQRAAGLLTPVVIISGAEQEEAREVIRALGEGAQDYIDKGEFTTKSDTIGARLKLIIEAFERKKNQPIGNIKKNEQTNIKVKHPDLLLLGASTGGTEALTKVLKNLPSNTPPVCVVQHISSAFATIFAERLANVSGLKLAGREEEGKELKRGYLYMAHGDYHIGLVQRGDQIIFEMYNIARIHGHRPSVDKLFQSAVGFRNVNIMAVLLTGMGRDGARGLTSLKNDGALTVAQDEDSCVIFGMPKEAIRMGGASFVGNLQEIRDLIMRALTQRRDEKVA